MNATIGAWLFCRAVRWLAWITFFGWSAYFAWDRQPHLNQFNHLLAYNEWLWFTSVMVAVFAGFLELMMRERTGLPRPRFGELIPARVSASDASGASPLPR